MFDAAEYDVSVSSLIVNNLHLIKNIQNQTTIEQ